MATDAEIRGAQALYAYVHRYHNPKIIVGWDNVREGDQSSYISHARVVIDAALDPDRAALVAQIERLEAALSVADDIHTWLDVMLPDVSQEDRDHLTPLCIAYGVLASEARYPGDLGEGGAESPLYGEELARHLGADEIDYMGEGGA